MIIIKTTVSNKLNWVMDLGIKYICLEPPARELISSYSLISKNELPLSGSWLRIAPLVWHTLSDEEEKRCLWNWPDELYQSWWSMGLSCHRQIIFTSGIYFKHWTIDLGRERGTIYTLSSRTEKVSHACYFHRVNFVKDISSVFLGNIEILRWHIYGLFSLDYLISLHT